MKLLFDENLSRRLVRLLEADYPGSEHVVGCGLSSSLDDEVFRFAGTHDFVLVTQDKDYQELTALHGAPPKVVWLRLGNSSTRAVAALLRSRRPEIDEFARTTGKSLLIVVDVPPT